MLFSLQRLKSLLTCSVCALAIATAAHAQVRSFNIPAGDLQAALDAYGAQSGLQIIYRSDELRGLSTQGLRGNIDQSQALARLLANTGLIAQRQPSGAIAIRRPSAGSHPTTQSTTSEPLQLTEITVTGTRLEDVPENGPQELRSYSHEQIAASGQPSITRFLNTLPEVSQNSSENNIFEHGRNTVQLRGFPVGTTLVLLDGHHAPNSGFGTGDAFDINNIPEGLLERVDILPFGSSAIYGSDALAGVVNFVLKRNFQGVSLSGNYGAASHYTDRSTTMTAGTTIDRGDIGGGVSYEAHHALTIASRPAIASGDFSRFAALGGQDTRTTSCLPGTVFALTGDLPGVGAPFAAIPTGLTGRPSTSDFLASANKQNLCNFYKDSTLIPDVKRISGLIYGDYDLTDRLHLYGTALVGHLETLEPQGPVTALGLVPATNAFNPFGVPVQVAGKLPIFQTDDSTTQFRHIEVGVKGDLLASWTWDANAHLTQDIDRVVTPNAFVFPALLATEASSDPATALNLFSTVDPGPGAAQAFKTIAADFGDRSEAAEVVFRGPLLRLPGGPLEMALGSQYERQSFTSINRPGFGLTGAPVVLTASGSRHLSSLFAELRAPLLASFTGGNKPALAVSGAVRYDHFSDFGSATTPQFGLELRPADSLLLRASFSKAFRAPTLFALFNSPITISTQVFDPKHDGAPVFVPATSGGNPDLRPETGRSWSVGGVWISARLPGLMASATYWNIQEQNRITDLLDQTLVDNETLFPGRVVRDASGNIVGLNTSFLNFGELRAEGVDVDVAYRFESPVGEFSPSISLTKTTHFEAALIPGSPLEDRLSRATESDAWAPGLKATSSLAWNRGPFSATLTGRYIGRYLDYQDFPNNNHLGDYWLADASVRIALDRYVKSRWTGLSGFELSVSAVNLFNRAPQYSNYQFGLTGFDPIEYDILGRLITVRLGARW